MHFFSFCYLIYAVARQHFFSFEIEGPTAEALHDAARPCCATVLMEKMNQNEHFVAAVQNSWQTERTVLGVTGRGVGYALRRRKFVRQESRGSLQ